MIGVIKKLIHYRMLKFYVRHGMIVDKVHDVFLLGQSKWLKKSIFFTTQKRNQAVNDSKEDVYTNYLRTNFLVKQ